MLTACWGLLKQDRELLLLPVMAAVTGLIAALILFVPGFAIGWAASGGNQSSWGIWVGGVLAAFAASVVAVYFQAALVIAANQRADGGDPTVRSALGEAWQHKGRILRWAVVTTTVGVAIRALEQRLGILGAILGFLGGVAWAIASFLVVPVLIAENLGPIEALKRSAELIRQTWGSSLRTGLRFGLIQLLLFLPAVLALVIGIFAVASGSGVGIGIGVVLILAGVIALLGLSMVFSAIATYARAMIYRYATGRPIPGIDPRLMAGAFAPRRARRGIA